MNNTADSGLSEVVSVALILTVLILTVTMIALIALPIMGTNAEQVHNGDILLEFAHMKADVDTVWLSESTNVKRQAEFTLSPAGDRTEITIVPNLLSVASFGTVTLTHGSTHVVGTETYADVNIIYTSSNMYAEEIELIYTGGTLIQNELILLPGSVSGSDRYIVVVNIAEVSEKSISGSGVVTLTYELEKIVTSGSDHLYVFSMELQ